MKTDVISCSTGPDSWHTYRRDLSQFVMTDEQYLTLILFLASRVIVQYHYHVVMPVLLS